MDISITSGLQAYRTAYTGSVSETDSERQHEEQSAAADGSLDSFVHTAAVSDEERALAPYDAEGEKGGRILPDRYYGKEIAGKVFYKGGSATYQELLEEAVTTGQYVLDESKSMWDNIGQAERILIYDKAAPLVPWSNSVYSEDGQYKLRIEGGEVTGMTAAFYYDESGRKITAQYLAEQLASGILPSELDGDWSFLAHFDPQLYQDSLEVGNAVRAIREGVDNAPQDAAGRRILEDDFFPSLILLLGRKAVEAAWHLLKGDEKYGPYLPDLPPENAVTQ